METRDTISWQTFKEALEMNPGLNLQFQYAENKWIDASYHITEIKQAPIVSVDCGGVMNRWTEIIVQLWEPGNQQLQRAMKVRKALSIIDIVEKALPLNPEGIVKIEFGNAKFDTRQMFPAEIHAEGEDMVVDLRPDAVQCKAISRGGNCGITGSTEECCVPAATEKTKVELKNLAAADPSCAPGSGCCNN